MITYIDCTLYIHKQHQSIVSASDGSVISHPDVPPRVRNSIGENEKLERRFYIDNDSLHEQVYFSRSLLLMKKILAFSRTFEKKEKKKKEEKYLES